MPTAPQSRAWARLRVWGRWLLLILAGAGALLVAGAMLLNSPVGKRYIANQIAALHPESGLKISVGRIEGSVFSAARIRDVRFSDPKGEFLRLSVVDLDWHPLQFVLRNRLAIDSVEVPRGRLSRLPELRPGNPDDPILPDFDIKAGRIRVDRLDIDAAVTGRAQTASLDGRANVLTGTADVDVMARVGGGQEYARLKLLAAPERNEFDVDADIKAPRDGVIAALTGVDQDVAAVVRGSGSWQNWRGTLLANANALPLASLRMNAADGRIRATGRVWPDRVATGLISRLSAGGVAVDADGRIAHRRWSGKLALVSGALQLNSEGNVDLARQRFDAMRIDGWIRRPDLLLNNMAGSSIRASALLDGAFQSTQVEYRLTAPWLSFGRVRLDGAEARGTGVMRRGLAQLPLALRVQRVSGIGALGERTLRNLRADGALAIRDAVLSTDLLRVQSDGLDGKVTILANFRSGDRLIGFDGNLPGVELAKLGRFDVQSLLTARAGRGGGFVVSGRVRALTRRLDNGFFRGLTGGLPQLDTQLSTAQDGSLRFDTLRVASPLLNLSGNGVRLPDGSVRLSGRGAHGRYGPFNAELLGDLARPRINLVLANPLPAARIRDLRLNLLPNAAGFAFTGAGGSLLGDFDAQGQIELPSGGNAVIALMPLSVGTSEARGRLTVAGGGLAGQLVLGGGGVNGTIALSLPRGVQRIDASLSARDARFAGAAPISIGRGTLRASVLLEPDGANISSRFAGSGLRFGSLTIARIDGSARINGDAGQVRVALAGARGREFALNMVANGGGGRWTVTGGGRLAGRAIALNSPAVLMRQDGGWRLAPTELSFGGGRVRLSGVSSQNQVDIDAGLERLPLALLDIGYPDLGLGGLASGRIQYRDAGGPPTGTMTLQVRDLTRAGLASAAEPLDVGINAALSANSVAVRGVAARNGTVIGRVQARGNPLPTSGPLFERIRAAPMIAQLRYSGEAGTLWRMTGIETVGLSGPVAVAADVSGTLNDPRIEGVVRANRARFENFQTGTVVTNASAVGRFVGSRLQLRSITGETPGGGTVTGEGDFDFSAASGLAMDVRMQATRALLVARDDLSARVSGPIRLFSSGSGGTISGNVTLDQGSFRLGQATSAQALPVLNVEEINIPADRRTPRVVGAPWQLALNIRGRNRFIVTGLGLNSEWSTDLQVQGPVDRFAITGTANLLRGDYEFAGRRFELRTGTIRFTGSYPVDPALDIVAVDDVSGIDASINVRGTGLRPEITFSSTPALPEDELLSRILFGSSVTDISVAEAAQLGIALAGLRSGGDGLDPINAIRRATGLDRLRILPANTEIGAGTAIAAGKYLTRRVFVEVVTDGQGYSATRVEYQITRWLALLASISTLGEESVNLRVHHDY